MSQRNRSLISTIDADERTALPTDRFQAPVVPVAGVHVGTLVGIIDGGLTGLVSVAAYDQGPLAARTIVDLHASAIGGDVALVFEEGNILKPILVGCIKRSFPVGQGTPEGSVTVDVDGRRLLIVAKDEMVFRCGKASITLTRVGKVIIEGAYVSNRSSGVLKLKGGAVHIN